MHRAAEDENGGRIGAERIVEGNVAKGRLKLEVRAGGSECVQKKADKE